MHIQKSTLPSPFQEKDFSRKAFLNQKRKHALIHSFPFPFLWSFSHMLVFQIFPSSQPQVRLLPSSYWDCCGLCMGMVSCLCSQLDPSKAHLTPSPLLKCFQASLPALSLAHLTLKSPLPPFPRPRPHPSTDSPFLLYPGHLFISVPMAIFFPPCPYVQILTELWNKAEAIRWKHP